MPYKAKPHQAHPPTPRVSPHRAGYDAAWYALSSRAIAATPYCVHCYSTIDLTTDHIIPLAQGGTSTEDNIQVLCRSCNSRKRWTDARRHTASHTH